MKTRYFFLLLLTVCGQFSIGQKILKENTSIQTILRLDNPLSRELAIGQYMKQNKLDKFNTFLPTYSTKDESNRIHQHFQQYYKGLKVEFGTLITHSFENLVYMINGEVYPCTSSNLNPDLSNTAAFTKIMQLKSGAKFMWDNSEDAAALHYEKPNGELLLLPNLKTGEIHLAYKFDIYTTVPLAREELYIDANSGILLYTNPIIKHVNESNPKKKDIVMSSVTGTANNTKYSGSRQIKTTFQSTTNKYILNDDTRGGGILTYNSARTTTYPSTNFTDADNNWTTAEFNNTNKDIGALDAHWGAEMTYDFWKNIFNRDSYDGLGTSLKSYVHYRSSANTSLVNAFWNGSVMSYGDGNNSVSILTSIDVCGHEIGHGVCSSTANLAYQNQSGAINEGLSDIWGACIEHYGRTGSLAAPFATGVWKIAEDLGTTPFRSMSSPTTYGNPDTYLGNNWTTTGDEGNCTPSTGNDQCGVHNNSGVMNHWFYIVTVGKSGTNNAPIPHAYSVTGIGMAKSSQIVFFAERDYLTPNATYLDMRNATLEVANSMYCGSSPEVIAITNAWYAVNVGPQYVGYPTDVSLKKIVQPISVACGANNSPTITFENTGTNTISSVAISYSIDGASPANLNWTGSLAACQTMDFPISISNLTRGTHSITISTTTSNDGNSANNTKSGIIVVNNVGTVNAINTFESANDALISFDKAGTNSLWQRGQASGTILNNTVSGGSNVYGTNLSGLYPDSFTSYLVSQCYDLTNILNPQVKFDMAFDLEPDFDFINVEYTTDGGVNWIVLGDAATGNTWYNNANTPNATNCQNCVGAQWTGAGTDANVNGGINANKTSYSWQMSDFGYSGATPQANIIFRFNFVSDPGVQNEGVIIDNFGIMGTPVMATQNTTFDLFNISPNPSNGTVTLQLKTSDNVKITLVDVSGRVCFVNEFQNSNSLFNQQINFGQLEKGVYLITITSDGKTVSKKLIIK